MEDKGISIISLHICRLIIFALYSSIEISETFKPSEKESFNIVLVDIQKTAAQEQVCCEEMEFQGSAVRYITLSYRWGELDEQFVPATDDYFAHVTSFALDDFYNLCKRIMAEPDLQDIRYVWVDAICVDQSNNQRKKIVIYRMNDIYKNAEYIVAIPDLYKEYLIKISDLNRWMSYQIQRYRWHIYHVIQENVQEVHRLDEDWARKLKDRSCQKDESNILDSEEEDDYIYHRLFDKRNQNKQSLTTEDQFTGSLFEKRRCRRIGMAIQYLLDLFLDWSRRTWVISEYSIAKEQREGKMKYWFIHLDKDNDFYGKPFFTLDFYRTTPGHIYDNNRWNVDSASFYHPMIISNTAHRSFIDMMLRSRATKNEDRFHAILPLSPKYNKVKVSKDTISSWNISGMQSVRLKLYEILDVEDKLYLLQVCKKQSYTILPTFASNFDMTLVPLYPYTPSDTFFEFNFDITDPSAVYFESDHLNNSSGYKGPSLHLRPKKYYIHDSLLQDMDEAKSYSKVMKKLGFESIDESFEFVTIPSFCTDDESDLTSLYAYPIHLFGSMNKNVWIICSFELDDMQLSPRVHVNKDYVFCVY
ncbi:uncharacterized protein BX664DRAFT_204996 [Halteromyces radiatus]|uniref:uncharacterized protein n=1 Tax=Halteromyces radiatus TaxID=101107 RepID=UPI00221EFAE5|nr:uncharacterized protein BX664DRAFT_204996 [Halteromyces radiatus]KAI8079917.1 hypothetical protein BX664DRAFT_204996 [Halteromyces radiatus]